MMEDKGRGLVVHEVNNTVEFHGASTVSDADIAGAMIDYAVAIVKK
jgi:[lysine-biosynthesis-protein LysW]--L-2-aminoadipate ligase